MEKIQKIAVQASAELPDPERFSLHEPDSIINLTSGLDGKIYSKAAEVEEFITISHPD